jgi:ABC-type transporter Mla subunit MlaD
MLNEIFRLFGTIVVDNESAKKNIDKTVEHAEKQQKTMQDKLANFGKTAIKVGTAFATAAATLGAALVNVANNTRDYRQEMGKLETAFERNQFSAENAQGVYKTLYGVIGDTGRVVEASGHIAQMSRDYEDLHDWTTICTGVFATFGDSLPIESLTEAANETAKTGEVTGSLADALNWAGEDANEFQRELDACNTEEERAKTITDTLVGLYGEAAQTYRENNSALIEANTAHDNLNSALAEMGDAAEPAVTAVTNATADLVRWAVPAVKEMADAVIWLIEKLRELATIQSTNHGELYDENGNLLDPTITPFMRQQYTDEELRRMGYDPSTYKPHSSGLDFVPGDGYKASLHYGEAVLTRSEANAWRRGQTGGIDYDRLAEAMAQRPMAFNIDGKAFAVMLAREMNRAIGNRNIQTLMAMGG